MRYWVVLTLLARILRADPGGHSVAQSSPTLEPERYGIEFKCPRKDLTALREKLSDLAKKYGWTEGQVRLVDTGSSLLFQLNTPATDLTTLDLFERPELKITTDEFSHRQKNGTVVTIPIASEKEILASLMQRGRTFQFQGGSCHFEALMDHVRERRRTVEWASVTIWNLPKEKEVYNPEVWNEDYTLKDPRKAREAINDIFTGGFEYAPGCRNACQFFMTQGVFDYTATAHPEKLELLKKIAGKNPFHGIRSYVDEKGDVVSQGKYLDRHTGVPPRVWAIGDWGYMQNTHPGSNTVFLDEGSNIIYTGGPTGFAKYYREHPPKRDFDTNLKYVYSWRYQGEDYGNTLKVDPGLMPQLEKTPEEGGFLYDFRNFPSLVSLEERAKILVPNGDR